jgi:hypothetical protein
MKLNTQSTQYLRVKLKRKKNHPIQSAKPVIRVNKDNFIECKLKEIIKSNSQPT